MSPKAIYGQDVILELYKVDGYYPVACAENVSIQFTMETKSVKTIGDGANRRVRGKAKGYEVSFDGVIGYGTGNASAWDLYEHYNQMTDILFRIIFRDNDSNLVKAIIGQVLPTDINLTGPNDLAGQSMTLIGNGPVSVQDNLLSCQATIGDIEFSETSVIATFTYSGVSDAMRLEYKIGANGGRLTKMNPGTSGTIKISKIILPAGNYKLYVYPICESGEEGQAFELEFTTT